MNEILEEKLLTIACAVVACACSRSGAHIISMFDMEYEKMAFKKAAEMQCWECHPELVTVILDY